VFVSILLLTTTVAGECIAAVVVVAGKGSPQNFYNLVFPPGKSQGACYYKRTVEALQDAGIKLRRRTGGGMTLERWVNFVHYASGL